MVSLIKVKSSCFNDQFFTSPPGKLHCRYDIGAQYYCASTDIINLRLLHIAGIKNIINQQRFIILSDVCNLLAIVFVLTVQYLSRFL